MEDFEFTIRDDSRPCIQEGFYEVMYLKSEKKKYYNSTKIYLWFEVITHGEHMGVQLFKAYNWYDPLQIGCDLYKDLVFISGKRQSKKARLSTAILKGKPLKAFVRTVKSSRKQIELATHLRYSVIDRLVEVMAGGE